MILEWNNIYNIGCLEGMNYLSDNSVDIIITSPPYNVDLGNNKFNRISYDIYDDNKEYSKYIEWLISIFKECYRVLKSGGRLCINIGDQKNGKIPTHSILTYKLIELGYLPYVTIIWNKRHTSCRTAWGSYLKPSCPSFPQTFEYIIVFAKESLKLLEKGETDLITDEFVKWTNPIWEIYPEINQKKFNHPAMFPEEIPYRLIKMFSYENANVLDIFSGMGTTCKVAKENNRNYLGFELSKEYTEQSLLRICRKKLF